LVWIVIIKISNGLDVFPMIHGNTLPSCFI
jgi:hypothetical protein